jgi:hypothetical protein
MLAEVGLRYLDVAHYYFLFDFKEIVSVDQLRAMASFLGKKPIFRSIIYLQASSSNLYVSPCSSTKFMDCRRLPISINKCILSQV